MYKHFTELVDFVGSRPKPFDNTKKYISTGALKTNNISEDDVEMIDYATRPSRADLEVKTGDILFAKMAFTDKRLLVGEIEANYIYSTGFFAVKPKEGILTPKCLFYLLNSETFRNQKDINSTGATQKAITIEGLKKINLRIPEYHRQNQIGMTLENIEKIIKLKEQQLTEYDQLIKSRFVEMFGDPTENPLNWNLLPLSYLGSLGRGKSKHRPRNAPELLGGEYPLIQTGDVANSDLYITEYSSTYSELGLKQSKMWDSGTLCITIAANIAKTAILKFKACFPDSIVGFIPNDQTNNIFIHCWFSFFQKVLEKQAPESAQKNINLRILEELQVFVPSVSLQNDFAQFVNQIDKLKFEDEFLHYKDRYIRVKRNQMIIDKEVTL